MGAEVIKKKTSKLSVDMQGAIVVYDRLKKVMTKFQYLDDRETVYQARFVQSQDKKVCSAQ